jgi:cytidyltransferase-like protein
MIAEAKKLGNRLIVIVANDRQAELKRPCLMPLEERMMIMYNIKGVDEVVASIDTGSDISHTLKMVKPNILASGCSKDHPDAIEEEKICKDLGIKTVYDVGGKKINSSSKILTKWETLQNLSLKTSTN